MTRLSTLALAAMTAIPLAGQTPTAAGTADRWEWVSLEGSPTWRFRLFVPAAVSAASPAPLVVMLHGCTQDPDDVARGTRLNALAAERGVVVAYPEQTAAGHPLKCWNWYDPAHRGAEGESGAVVAVARQVMRQLPIDPQRVYVAGISAGGAMAQSAGLAGGDLFAAIGVHSGVPFGAADDMATALGVMRGDDMPLPRLVAAVSRASQSAPPALIAIHGEADAVVSPRNIAAIYVQWSALHGAGQARDDSLSEGGRAAVRTRYLRPDGSYSVELWRVDGLGHAWSGGSAEGTFTDASGPDATRLMLDFFLSHPRRPRP